VATASQNLARLSHTSLLGLEFVLTPAGRWLFTNALPQPDLRLGGEPLLDDLARSLRA
jgi:hypothetical protein